MLRKVILVFFAVAFCLASAAKFSRPNLKIKSSKHSGTVLSHLPPLPPYETRFIDQPTNHFWPGSETYKQRYFYADKFFGKPQPTLKLHRDQQDTFTAPEYAAGCPGPILFYTGNESPVDLYYEASGFFTQYLAPKLGALLVFAEHRYFGESFPFGKDYNKHPQYLSSELALLDYATLLDSIQNEVRVKYNLTADSRCPVIAFGGSYGGMLTAWFRSKYPHIVDGALAASGPFGFINAKSPRDRINGDLRNVVDVYSFYDVVTETICTSDNKCCDDIRQSLSAIDKLASSPAGLTELTKIFKLCKPLTSGDDLMSFIYNGFVTMTMMDYPYPTNYVMDLPGYPVNKTCNILTGKTMASMDGNGVVSGDEFMSIVYKLVDSQSKHTHTPKSSINIASTDNDDVLVRMTRALNVPYNYSGNARCFDVDSRSDLAWDLAEDGWDYLSCTGLYFPMTDRGVFGTPDAEYDPYWDNQNCLKDFNLTISTQWGHRQYGSFSFPTISNTIFSNGFLDPWSGVGLSNITWIDKLVNEEYDIPNNSLPSRSVHVININLAAHHLDLRAPCEEDPATVIDARIKEEQIINQWLKPYLI